MPKKTKAKGAVRSAAKAAMKGTMYSPTLQKRMQEVEMERIMRSLKKQWRF